MAGGYLGARYNNRLLVSIFGTVISIIGMLLIIAVPASHPTARLVGYYLTQASAMPFVALLGLIATNVAGYTKKTTVAALYLIAYCTGNIIGWWLPMSPCTYVADDSWQVLRHSAQKMPRIIGQRR